MSTTAPKRSRVFPALQKIGRSLQLPIAVLPAAGILLRLGQDDVFGADGLHWTRVAEVFAASGHAVFDWMPLLFCVGIAIGYAKKSDGSTALAALVGFLTYHQVLTAFPKTGYQVLPGHDVEATYQDPGVLGGVVVGLLSAILWQRLHRTRLVDWLGFFNGRRLVPIVMAFVGTGLGVFFGLCWGPIGSAVDSFSNWVIGLGWLGSGIFGVINRALLPFGLHQIANTFFWQQAGSFDVAGRTVHGDQTRFFQFDPAAGQFMSGFFPVMMFGLPAAALAIAHCARPERRRAVLGMMFSLALTSFVTGITEPIEFAFVFIAPALYVVHALLTGASMALTWALGVHHGFTFSAGVIDYVLNWRYASHPWLIVPIGLVFAVVYYTVFRFVILRFDLKTPGREEEDFEDG
ncbi:PTS transporter subunit EIIC [Streptomyces sp. TLI_171]|uniref:PTS transporter subunit EIIC n=1 Tax=Streptomyces sp. TLI_171 TaxID=1938859 RepID=UPI000C193658|nr:PTS transporter subunit EIIC [Streptomyces sp. TLI_171]RKE19237.1 PTS system N-acetylglucosamine-specific IIC component (Glc family) [Streptomyces sp. TLI_171]